VPFEHYAGCLSGLASGVADVETLDAEGIQVVGAQTDIEVERIDWNLNRHNVTYLHGTARVVDGHTVEVVEAGETKNLTAEFILVATGSVPFQPASIPFADPDIDDSDTILQLDRLPKSMTVIGGGVIGCEYASMFCALGVKVTLIEPRDELLSFLDAEISEALRVALINLGIDVRLNTSAGEVKRVGDQIVTSSATPRRCRRRRSRTRSRSRMPARSPRTSCCSRPGAPARRQSSTSRRWA